MKTTYKIKTILLTGVFAFVLLSGCGSSQPDAPNTDATMQSALSTDSEVAEKTVDTQEMTDEVVQNSDTEPTAELHENEPSSTGDGMVTRDDLLKIVHWIADGNAKDMTYQEVVEYIGVEGLDRGNTGPNTITELGDHYFDWCASDTEFIHVCFRGNEDTGLFLHNNQWNTSGLLSEEWEAVDISDWVDAAVNTETVPVESMIRDDDYSVSVTCEIPTTWSYTESSDELSLNAATEDQVYSNTPKIKVSLDELSYLESRRSGTENMHEISAIEISGISMKGWSYELYGMDWVEYTGALDDTEGICIRIAKLDMTEGREGSNILNSMSIIQ